MRTDRLEPFFIDSSAGRIFALLQAPAQAERCVLFVPPFGEEMNKCRRQVAETSRALVAEGYGALVVDVFGTGDSEGEFVEATWDIWKKDIQSAMAWASDADLAVEALVATRLGCALAAESLRSVEQSVARTVFWQPVENGRQYMSQFLRLRVAASMMEPDARESVEGLKNRLQRGEPLKVAGYQLSSKLWAAIEVIELAGVVDGCLGDLLILEAGRSRDGELSVTGQRLLSIAKERGLNSTGLRVSGEPFWTATEIVVNSELQQLTVQHLTEAKH